MTRKTLFLMTVLLAVCFTASAATITISAATNLAGAQAARAAWLGGSPFVILENFESFTAGTHHTSLATGVGTFTANGLGSTGAGTGLVEFSIHDAATTPFGGRSNTTPGGANWLDSNDITKLELSTSLTKLFFFMTDVEDVGAPGELFIKTGDGTTAMVSSVVLPNGKYHFVGIDGGGQAITSIWWKNGQRNDGFGLDDFGTPIPEPATYALLGGSLGLLGLLRFRKRS